MKMKVILYRVTALFAVGSGTALGAYLFKRSIETEVGRGIVKIIDELEDAIEAAKQNN